MDIFARLVRDSRGYLRDALMAAAHQLGVFAALAAGPLDVAALAQALGVRPRRLRALVDALVLEGALVRVGLAGQAGLAALAPVPMMPVVPPLGWGQLAEVIRRDRSLDPAAAFGDSQRARDQFHQHLDTAGEGPARELAERLAPLFAAGGTLLDAGGGSGTYTAALLEAAPAAQALLVDRAEVLPLARLRLARYGERVSYRGGDLLEADLGVGHRVALLSNLLHLHGPEVCARLVLRSAAALAEGGELVVKDLLIRPDRSGPATGVLFAVNMALFTAEGDVYDPPQIEAFLTQGGLRDVSAERLETSPESVLVRGQRSLDHPGGR